MNADTLHLQDQIDTALNAGTSAYGPCAVKLESENKVYEIEDTVHLRNSPGVDWLGLSRMGTRFRWVGSDSTKPMFQIERISGGIGPFMCEVAPGKSCLAPFVVTNTPSGYWNTTAVTFRNVWVDGTGGFKYAYLVDHSFGGGSDANSEHLRWVECDSRGFSDYAVRIKGTQAHSYVFDGFRALGNQYGQGVIKTDNIVSIDFRGGGGGGFVGYEFDLHGNSVVGSSIRKWNSEWSRKFLRIGEGGYRMFDVEGLRWEGRPVAGEPVVLIDRCVGSINFQGHIRSMTPEQGGPATPWAPLEIVIRGYDPSTQHDISTGNVRFVGVTLVHDVDGVPPVVRIDKWIHLEYFGNNYLFVNDPRPFPAVAA